MKGKSGVGFYECVFSVLRNKYRKDGVLFTPDLGVATLD